MNVKVGATISGILALIVYVNQIRDVSDNEYTFIRTYARDEDKILLHTFMEDMVLSRWEYEFLLQRKVDSMGDK